MDNHSILVKIKADAEEFKKAMNEAGKKLDDFGKTASGISKFFGGISGAIAKLGLVGQGLSTAFGAVQGVIGPFYSSFVEIGASLELVSKQTNVTVEGLSRLKYAASQNGVEFETMADALKTFQEQLGAARFGDQGTIDKFKAVGIDAGMFDGLSAQEQFLKLAEYLAGLKDSTQQARAAIELFGDSGYQLLPFFQQGKAGIEALCQEADKLGVTFSEKDAESARELQKNLESLKSAFTDLMGEAMAMIAGPLSQGLTLLKDMLAETRNAFREFASTDTLNIPEIHNQKATLNQQLETAQARVKAKEARFQGARDAISGAHTQSEQWNSDLRNEAAKEYQESLFNALSEHEKEIYLLDQEYANRKKILDTAVKQNQFLLQNKAIDEDEARRAYQALKQRKDELNYWYDVKFEKIEAVRLAKEKEELERKALETQKAAAEEQARAAENQRRAQEEKQRALAEELRIQEEIAAEENRLADAMGTAARLRSDEAIKVGRIQGQLADKEDERNLLLEKGNPNQPKVLQLNDEIDRLQNQLESAKKEELESSLTLTYNQMLDAFEAFERADKFNKDNPAANVQGQADREEELNTLWQDYLEKMEAFQGLVNVSKAGKPMFEPVTSRGTFSAYGIDAVLGADIQKQQLDNLKKICTAVMGIYENAQGQAVLKPAAG